ncbi:YebC/PmpR family DNA-binding transcriptional regulator [Patescibacteria group bacterium]|nr:YebC/PmpR family DNA-binding transcriptional regulator [Patescibacteria group bacterium]
MSGHNKWSKIKRQKEKTDGQKSKIYGKMVKLITAEAKKAHGDVTTPGLRSAIEKAKSMNVPSDNIERAIKKFSEGEANMETIVYEAYGPGGCAIVIEALTDNRNRAAQEIKRILGLHDIALAAIGSATWAFSHEPGGEWIAQSTIPLSDEDGEKLGTLVDELEECDEVQDVYTNAE